MKIIEKYCNCLLPNFEEKKLPAKEKATSGTTYNVSGGTVYHIGKIVAGRDAIQGDQTNISYHFPEPQTSVEFIEALKLIEMQIAATPTT